MCEYREIEYRRVGETSLKLDIYQPKGLTHDTAALIFVHGGSWRGGDRQDYLRCLVDFAEAGHVTVTVSYRFAQASPVSYISSDDPPTLIFHGTLDETVPVNQSDLLKQQLDRHGVASEYPRLEGWPHTMDAAVSVNR